MDKDRDETFPAGEPQQTSQDADAPSGPASPMGDAAVTGRAAAGPDGVENSAPQGGQHTGQHRHVRIVSDPGGTETRNGPKQQAGSPPGPAAPTEPPQLPQPQQFRPDLRQEELVKGSHPGDRYIKVGRTVGPFRRKSGGVLEVSTQADEARSRFGRIFNSVKHVMIGRPISTEHSIHERLTK